MSTPCTAFGDLFVAQVITPVSSDAQGKKVTRNWFLPRNFSLLRSVLETAPCDSILEESKDTGSIVDAGRGIVPRFPFIESVPLDHLKTLRAQIALDDGKGPLHLLDLMVFQRSASAPFDATTSAFTLPEVAAEF
jgi:hypothetical protein